jgi:hypothetical protein
VLHCLLQVATSSNDAASQAAANRTQVYTHKSRDPSRT